MLSLIQRLTVFLINGNRFLRDWFIEAIDRPFIREWFESGSKIRGNCAGSLTRAGAIRVLIKKRRGPPDKNRLVEKTLIGRNYEPPARQVERNSRRWKASFSRCIVDDRAERGESDSSFRVTFSADFRENAPTGAETKSEVNWKIQ